MFHRPWGTPEYVKALRKAMDKEGFATKLVLGDGGMPNVLAYQNDSEFMAAFDAVGLHYPCDTGSLRGQGEGLLAAGKHDTAPAPAYRFLLAHSANRLLVGLTCTELNVRWLNARRY